MGEIEPVAQSHMVTDLRVTESLSFSLPTSHTPFSHFLTGMKGHHSLQKLFFHNVVFKPSHLK